MLPRLFLIFVLVPLADLLVLLIISKQLHWLVSFSVVIVSGLIGAILVKRQGSAALSKVRHDFQSGTIPADPLFDGALIIFAAGLLITPGLMTDVAGISHFDSTLS